MDPEMLKQMGGMSGIQEMAKKMRAGGGMPDMSQIMKMAQQMGGGGGMPPGGMPGGMPDFGNTDDKSGPKIEEVD